MSSLRSGLQQLRCSRQLLRSQTARPQWTPIAASPASRRHIATDQSDSSKAMDDLANGITALPLSDNAPKFDEQIIAQTGIRAAPPKPFKDITKVRAVPTSPSYFTRSPYFFDSYIKIQGLYNKYRGLPTLPQDKVPPQLWKSTKDFKAGIGQPVSGGAYLKTIKMVKHLYKIEPRLMPKEVPEAIEQFKRGTDPHMNVAQLKTLDRFGRSIGVGKRKTSTARAWLVEGTGEVQINGKPLSEAFGRVHDRESAIWALKATERVDKYNVWALVSGGGTTGQAEALALAIAKALLPHEPALKPMLRQAGCITRDPRQVERKKHGHLKARKSPAWVKR